MNYDIHGSWEMTTGFSAPLRATEHEPTPQNTLAAITEQWIKEGCDRSKLIFGG